MAFFLPSNVSSLEKGQGASLGTVLLPSVPCPTAAPGSTASSGLVYTCTSPTPKAQPQHQPCSCGWTLCPRGDKLWFHWTPPCFLTPLWHFVSGETETLQYTKAACLLTLLLLHRQGGSFSIETHTALPVLSSWRMRVEEEALTCKPHKYLLPCPPRAVIWGLPLSCAQLT